MAGRVFVYCLPTLLEGALQASLLLVATRFDTEDIFLVVIVSFLRQDQPPVRWLNLERQRLLTGGGGTVVMYHFWTDHPSNVSEFFK